MSKRALLPQQESVAVATLVIINKNDIIQQLSESLYINTIYIYIFIILYFYIHYICCMFTFSHDSEPFSLKSYVLVGEACHRGSSL